jgi:2-hydroxychromene-2-carboxylate isomerase
LPCPPLFHRTLFPPLRPAVVGADEAWVAPFKRAIFEAELAHGADIADTRRLDTLLRSLHLDSEGLLSRIAQPDMKARPKQQTAQAQTRGIFGAPSFICQGELFWGDDRV